jgi:uncharacterized protein
MEQQNYFLSAHHFKEIGQIITALVEHYKPMYIICFGCLNDLKTANSCFIGLSQEEETHYFLLMVTTEVTRIEHDVQSYVNSHFNGVKITIIVHGLEIVSNAIAQGSRFFITTCKTGLLLYSANGLRLDFDYPNLNPATTLAKAEKHYRHRYNMAVGFVEAAGECLDKEFYNNTVFMLHQAVEQACIAMVRVFIAYRSDMHNLIRLLHLCRCFSDEPLEVFPLKTDADRNLFQLLLKSYSDARYRDEYNISAEDAGLLWTRVKALVELAGALCTGKINEYRKTAEEFAESKQLMKIS